MKIVFRNLGKSSVAKSAVKERLGDMVEKFPRLVNHQIVVTLFMENSPAQPGPDSYGVKVLIRGSKYRDIALTKSASSLFHALAEVREHLLEVLNRFGDKCRVARRRKERKHRKLSQILGGSANKMRRDVPEASEVLSPDSIGDFVIEHQKAG